jgi:hypothetical protein
MHDLTTALTSKSLCSLMIASRVYRYGVVYSYNIDSDAMEV